MFAPFCFGGRGILLTMGLARVWHQYGYPLPNTCETAAIRVPNIKVAVWASEVIVKKVKNEHRFIGQRT